MLVQWDIWSIRVSEWHGTAEMQKYLAFLNNAAIPSVAILFKPILGFQIARTSLKLKL